MNEYAVFTDCGCDIPHSTLEEWGVKELNLTFHFTDSEQEYTNLEMSAKEFYDHMRVGRIAKTSAVNVESFRNAFEEALKAGKDVLYIGFSGGLSNTSNAGQLAANELRELYPERKLIAIDSLCASAGQGLLLRLALDQRDKGVSIEEVAAYLEENKLHLCHEFTVDDLVYLKRGGRVSATVALIGTMLSIKPVMHVDNEGHLVKLAQARGRKASLKALVDKYSANALDPEHGRFFICHGDCLEDAQRVDEMIHARHGNHVDMIVYTGQVIGAHSGPGTLALFYLGSER